MYIIDVFVKHPINNDYLIIYISKKGCCKHVGELLQ